MNNIRAHLHTQNWPTHQTGWKNILKIHLSRKLIQYFLLLSAGLVAVWLLRGQLGLFLRWVGDRQAVIDSIQQFGAWGPAFLFLLLILQVFLAIIPGHVLMIAGGYVYGFPLSLLIVLGSTILGSEIAFWVARYLGRPVVYRLASPPAIQRWEQQAAYQGIVFYFFHFCSAIIPQ
jgi:uncharacterized membrane protein YdjX (TVP38/TMEM64 family)